MASREVQRALRWEAHLKLQAPAVRQQQNLQNGLKLEAMNWLTASPAGQVPALGVRNWNRKLCCQAVWLRSYSRTCTLFLSCCENCCEENYFI
jgi:hypothetical protein